MAACTATHNNRATRALPPMPNAAGAVPRCPPITCTTRPTCWAACAPGPDLMNIGVRQPSQDWHLGHLHQPRAYVPARSCRPTPYMFEVKDQADAGEVVVKLPPGQGPKARWSLPSPRRWTWCNTCKALSATSPSCPLSRQRPRDDAGGIPMPDKLKILPQELRENADPEEAIRPCPGWRRWCRGNGDFWHRVPAHEPRH